MMDNLVESVRRVVETDEVAFEEIIKQIDWAELASEIRNFLGLSHPITIMPKLSGRRASHISWDSPENLVADSGLFKSVMKTLKAESFSSSTIDEVQREGTYWCGASLAWTFIDGGSNGHALFNAWWDMEKKRWTFGSR